MASQRIGPLLPIWALVKTANLIIWVSTMVGASTGEFSDLQSVHPRYGYMMGTKYQANANNDDEEGDTQMTMEETCSNFGGTLVVDECLKVFIVPDEDKVTWEEASTECKSLDGYLWVPEKNDVLLYEKFFSYFPEAFDKYSFQAWIGVRRNGAGGPAIGEDGTDLSDQIAYSGVEGKKRSTCYSFQIHNQITRMTAADCESTYASYLCEFGIPAPTGNGGQNNLFSKNPFKLFSNLFYKRD